jgi:hypothetical protein
MVTTARMARVLLGQLRELRAPVESGELPVGPAYRHRLEGGIAVLEAVLGVPSSLVSELAERSRAADP